MQGRNGDADVENGLTDTEREGEDGTNGESSIVVYTQSRVKWIKKKWYIYTMEYYSAINSRKFESVEMRWTYLEPVIQSEVSQKEKSKYCILTHIYGI